MSETEEVKADIPPKQEIKQEADSGVPSRSTAKRPRTSADFYRFCEVVLEYANYDATLKEEERASSASPLGSTGSVPESMKSDPSINEHQPEEEIEISSDDESYDMITCYCRKPFAGRPMIECSRCRTWIHLSCAKLRKTNIPKVFICIKCKQRTRVNGVSSRKNPSPKRKMSS